MELIVKFFAFACLNHEDLSHFKKSYIFYSSVDKTTTRGGERYKICKICLIMNQTLNVNFLIRIKSANFEQRLITVLQIHFLQGLIINFFVPVNKILKNIHFKIF